MDLQSNVIQVWHGAHRWDGKPKLITPKKGHAECGAGIYGTTKYMTAKKYAAGGGSTRLFTLRSDITFLEDTKVKAMDLARAVKQIPRLKCRHNILDDIEHCRLRSRDQEHIGLNTLVNLAVNYDAMVGNPAVDISEYLVTQGVDASLVSHSGEDWIVIFNPNIILKHEAISANDVDLAQYELPRITRNQLVPPKITSEPKIEL